MRIAEYKQSEGVIYRDMTAEEAELLADQPDEMPVEKSPEERIAELEAALEALISGVTE